MPIRPLASDASRRAGSHAARAEAISGEVRFDRLSRALYSTDASVYQIVPARRRPAAVGGRRRGRSALRRHRVPLTAGEGAPRRRVSRSDPA